MIEPDFFRVVPDEHSAWDNTRAVMVTYDAGWCLYEWHSMDKLLRLEYFTEDGDYIDWEGYYFGSNPLPTMWASSPHATDEMWYDGAMVA